MTGLDLDDYFDYNKYLRQEYDKIAYDVLDGTDLFEQAFGYDYEKYYIPFESSVPQDMANSRSLIEFYINAISCIEYECGEIEDFKIAKELSYDGNAIYCYKNNIVSAVIVPMIQYFEIYFHNKIIYDR